MIWEQRSGFNYSTRITGRRVLEEKCMLCLCVQFPCPRTQNLSIIYSGFISFLSSFRHPGSSFMWPSLELKNKTKQNRSVRLRVTTVASIIVVVMNCALELMRKLVLLRVCMETLKQRTFQHWMKMSKCGPLPSPHLWLSSYCFHRPLHCIFLCFKLALHRDQLLAACLLLLWL